MFVTMRGKQGQAISGEYVILITLVLAALGGMTMYVKRAYQGRIRDAGFSMMYNVANKLGNSVQWEYEPYYVLSETQKAELSYDDVSVGGTYKRNFGSAAGSLGISNQLPPKDAN